MKTTLKRLTALILALSMALSLLSTGAWAADLSEDTGPVAVQSEEEPEEEPGESEPDSEPEEEPEDPAEDESEPEEAEAGEEAEQESEAEEPEAEDEAEESAQNESGMSLTAYAAPSIVATRITSQDLTNYTGYGNLPGWTTLSMSERDTVSDLPKTGEVWLVFSADGFTTKYVDGVAQTSFTLAWSSLAYQINTAGKQVYYPKGHIHDFTCSADGATITATCGAANCGLTANPTLTIVKPTLETCGQTGDGISASATLDGVEDFNTATELTVEKTAIKYYKATKDEGGVYTRGEEITTGAPTDAGDYMAEITLSGVKTGAETTGDVTASVGYTITYVDVTGVTLSPDTAQTIAVDGKVSFTATVQPDNASDKTVKWSVGGTNADAVTLYSDKACENPVTLDTATDVLTVYAKGISEGTSTVTVTSNADNTD